MGDLDYLFGPINRKYCIYFYILSVIGFIYFATFIVSGIYIGIAKRKTIEYYLYLVMGASVFFLFYFQNRLLYTMCNQSL